MPITDTKARKAKAKEKPYKIADSEGLFLEVRPTGKKIWRYRFYVGGKEGVFTVGEYPSISLSDARKERDWARSQARKGVNPNTARKQLELEQSVNLEQTFESLAADYRAIKAQHWSGQYVVQFDELMESDIFPVIGCMPVAAVRPAHVLKIIDAVVGRGAPSIARICRMHMSKIFRLAASRLLVEYDPTHLLADAIPRKPVEHFKTIPTSDIPELLSAIERYGGRRTGLGVKLLLHTFLRGAEVRKARWKEISFSDRMWRVPAEHTKKRRLHLVPLSDQSLEILRELESFYGSDPDGCIFPNRNDPSRCMPKRSMDAAIEYMGFRGRFSLHGFRSAASTVLNENKWHPDAIERQLSHMEVKSERRAYNHAQYLDIRTEMMQWWSDYITQL